MTPPGAYSVRFRHSSGEDIGPFTFSSSSSVAELKDRLFQEWPNDGPISKDRPASLLEIRLISGGKFLENSTTLASLSNVIGQPDTDLSVTMHVIIRPPAAAKAAACSDKQKSKSCMCTIC